MRLTANDPNRKSWLKVPKDSDFPIQNIPFGVFLTRENISTIGTRIGNYAIDLRAMHQLGYFKEIELADDIFSQNSLNSFIADGRKTWRLVRNRISEVFLDTNPHLKEHTEHCKKIIFPINEVKMQLPVHVGDYTDFYASKEHAINVGSLFRDPKNALLPNWLRIPIGYHGRSSSIIVSGTPIHRPIGQTKPGEDGIPKFGPSKLLDFELEMAFITTTGNELGKHISIEDAEDYIFGLVLFNDWSARDIQAWEYVPLGPFLGKNFASTISPWIVTLDALQPFRVDGPKQEPAPLPYLQQGANMNIDIHLQATIQTEDGNETVVANSNFKHMYWSMAQQLTHHTVNGCNIRSGDMMGSGTISGTTKDSFGSMLELTWKGQNPIQLNDGSKRKFINDQDTVIMKGYCKNDTLRIGFGECTGKILPARDL